MEKDTTRVIFTISKELKAWYEKVSVENGMTQSSLMAMALLQYKQQQEVVLGMNKLTPVIEQLNDIKAKLKELEK